MYETAPLSVNINKGHYVTYNEKKEIILLFYHILNGVIFNTLNVTCTKSSHYTGKYFFFLVFFFFVLFYHFF